MIPDEGQGKCLASGLQFLGNQKFAKGFLNNAVLTRWPALLTKHLNLLESHVSLIDQLLHNISRHSSCDKSKDLVKCELLEKYKRKTLTQMLNGARDVLEQTREAAREILPQLQQNEKENQDIEERECEKSETGLHLRTQSSGHDATRRGKTGQGLKNNLSSHLKYSLSHNTLTHTSESNPESHSKDPKAVINDFALLYGKKKNLSIAITNKNKENVTISVPNGKFTSSTNGPALNRKTKTNLGITEPNEVTSFTTSKIHHELKDKIKHQNSRRKSEPGLKTLKKENITRSEFEANLSEVDFAALEATLLAEIAAEEKTSKHHVTSATNCPKGKTDKKRRRRSSERIEVEKKRIKKTLTEEKGKFNKKRKAQDSLGNMDTFPNLKKRRYEKERG